MTFISEEELAVHLSDGRYVAEKANEYIRFLEAELERAKAAADASSIMAEQTCSVLEQKFLALSAEFEDLESRNGQLQASLDDRVAEVADIQSQKHQLSMLSIEKDGEIERLMTELSELNKSKRQLLELIRLKDSEIAEKNASLNSYLDKIVNLTENGAQREARLSEVEVELSRSQATASRLMQEKELVERHNAWLNDELSSKVNNLLELRKNHAELQEEMAVKLSDADRKLSECSKSLNWNVERVKELETKLLKLQEDFSSSKEIAASNEEQLSAELSTVNKLVELYKENSEEWSRKAGELEGVVKALEIHTSQVESDYKDKLEKQASLVKTLEQEVADLKVKLDRSEAEVENRRKEDELQILPGISFTAERWIEALDTEKNVDELGSIVPKIPVGVSGTALAASLLRDGWSLAKMYSKYQEAVDALRHEQLGRKDSEAVLQRVLCELEEKAGIILDERAEYERMVDSYDVINNNLQRSIDEKAILEKTIQELKVDLRRSEREYALAQKDISDLQKQVTVLLKECRDIQLHCGSMETDQYVTDPEIIVDINEYSGVESVISKHLLKFRDINGLVGQNAQLRRLVRDLSEQIEDKEKQFEERLGVELKRHADEAEAKVAAVISRAEEQGRMIESLHTSVSMYKRLYEEEHNLHASCSHQPHISPVVHNGRKDLFILLEDSQEASKKAQEKAVERVRLLEEDLAKARSDIIFVRSEREKSELEVKFAREKLESFMKECEYQRTEMNNISARNVELSRLLVEYQKKLRESSDSLNLSEEHSRKFSMEISILKHEKEMLSIAEKRACEEVRNLSERVYRLQASLDTIQSADQIREEARVAEKTKQDEYIKHLEREWAEAKKDLQQERDNLRIINTDRELMLKSSGKQFEELTKELTKALNSATTAESRAVIAEAKLSDLEKKITSHNKISGAGETDLNYAYSPTEVVTDLLLAKKEIEKLKEEAKANKEHMLQYKNIAQVNEGALKQMEVAHEAFKIESERLKESLETEMQSLKSRIVELEDDLVSKTKEVIFANSGREETLASALAEVASLKEEVSTKRFSTSLLESEIFALKEDLEKERARRCTAQGNYERQVILQSETIQELTRTSETLASIQQEASVLRNLVHELQSENSDLKNKWDGEKKNLEISKTDAENRYNELNLQNKILHDRLEALHIQLAEKQRLSAAISPESTGTDSHDDGALQNVINYLRRSKEIGETEISLLKQEKLRLQSQLETALKTVEKTQSLLHAERERSRAILFTEEEIKSMQLQIREMNLLRESNTQLREESKHNFEECQKVREINQKAQVQILNLETLLHEKDAEIEACKKKLELEIVEKDDVEKKLSELIERSRNISVEEYDQMKNELRELKERIKAKDERMQEMHEAELKLQETVIRLEKDIIKHKTDASVLESKLQDMLQTETRLRSDLEKQKKLWISWKKKCDSLSKEKDEMAEEKQALIKQFEESKQASRRPAASELISKEKEEKDHRIQILEKTVERQREELRKREDRASFPIRQPIIDAFKDLTLMRSKVEQQKLILEGILGNSDIALPEDIPRFCISVLDDFASYLLWVENLGNSIGVVATQQESLPDTSPPVAPSSSAKAADEKETNASAPKPVVEPRRTARKLVRPKLVVPEESLPDVEMSEPEASVAGKKLPPTADSEAHPVAAPSSSQIPRKRLASSAADAVEPPSDGDAAAHAVKRTKGADEVAGDAETRISSGLPEEPSDIGNDLNETPKDDVAPEKEVELPFTEGKPSEGEMLMEVNTEPEVEEDDSKNSISVDSQQVPAVDSDKEEGELIPDAPEVEEVAAETQDSVDESPDFASPVRLDDDAAKDDEDVSEQPEGSPILTSEGDVSKPADADASRNASEMEEVKQVSPAGSSASTVVNLAERAKERAMLRQFGPGALPPSGSTVRGRSVRGRATRGGARGGARGGRGQSPGSQGF